MCVPPTLSILVQEKVPVSRYRMSLAVIGAPPLSGSPGRVTMIDVDEGAVRVTRDGLAGAWVIGGGGGGVDILDATVAWMVQTGSLPLSGMDSARFSMYASLV